MRRMVHPSVFVLLSIVVMLTPILPVMYSIGSKWERERHFLDNYRAPNEFEVYIFLKMRYARETSEANDVIFLGDSTCNTDVQTLVYEQKTKARAYNLALLGVLGMQGNRLEFEQYLQHHPKPRAVFLCLNPTALGVPDSTLGPAFVRDRFVRFFGSEDGPFEPLPGSTIATRIRRGILVTYGDATGGYHHYLNEPIPFHPDQTFNSIEATAKLSRGSGQLHAPLKSAPRISLNPDDPFPLSEENRQAITEFGRLTGSLGIKLFIRLTPVEPSTTAENYQRVDEEFSKIENACPNTILMRPAIVVYPRSLFGYVNHCNVEGAELFTANLARDSSINP